MKITILNGNPDPENRAFEDYLSCLSQSLIDQQHQVALLPLRDMDIRYCIGCFNCWVKTPGECQSLDESSRVCLEVINSDFTLWAAPLKMGFPSALLKKAMDKTIPLIHPYFTVAYNEAHHRARYDHYPRLGLLVQKEADTDPDDLRIITDIFSRTAVNMKSRLAFSMTTDQPVEQLSLSITREPAKPISFVANPKPTLGHPIPPPTHLTVFNGSPRGQKGNTPLLLDQFLKGFTANPGCTYELYHLNHIKDAIRFQQAYSEASATLIGFPLYTDAMPGLVKAFIETLEPFKSRPGNPPMGFLVQSGFPEAAHSRHVEAYLEKLAGRLGSPYLGTIVKGGAEGIQSMPESMTKKLFESFFQIGKSFGETGRFDPVLLQALARPEKYPFFLGPVFKLLSLTPLLSFYWDGQLKQNGAFEKRFAKPYAVEKAR